MIDEITQAIRDGCFEAYKLGYEAGVKSCGYRISDGMYWFTGSDSKISDYWIWHGFIYSIWVSKKKVRYGGHKCIEAFIKHESWPHEVRVLYGSEDTFRDNWEKLD